MARVALRSACVAIALALPALIHAQISIPTNRYNQARTGADLKETVLTVGNVTVTRFGRLYSYPVDGAVYAQPLFAAGVVIAGIPRNVLYVATMNDKVYAFDADNGSPAPLWTRDFTNPPSVTPVPIADITVTNQDIVGNVGIQSTPVIDGSSGTLFLVARTKENGEYVQRLHALDIATGLSRGNSPVTIAGSVPGSAPDATVTPAGTVVPFNPMMQNQRAGLALSNGVVLVAWSGHHDLTPYHGWVMGFDSSTLQRVGIFAVTRDYYGGGIWQGGRAPAIDAAGNAYFATGNGAWDGARNFSETLLKFSVTRSGMALVDYFTPGNEATLGDQDLSGSGFTLLPGTNLLIGGGKEGVLYVLDASNLGKKTATDSHVVQKIVVNGGHIMGGPVYWDAPVVGPLVYNWSEDDVLVAYRVSAGQLVTTPYAKGAIRSPGHPGGSLTVSANGSTANTGIVWASMPTSEDALSGLHAGILRAYNAETAAEIYNSEQDATRDRLGTLTKFVPPSVAGGKVFMATQSNAVAVYGLRQPDFAVTATPRATTIVPGATTTLSVAVAARSGFVSAVGLSATGAPAGTTVAFNPPSITGSGTSTMTIAVPSSIPANTTMAITVAGVSGSVHRYAAPVAITVTAAATSVPEIVRYASRATIKAGTWRLASDVLAAGGERLEQPDAGAAKVATALAAPSQYVELTFNAEAGRAYRLWLRGRAQNNSYANDSVYVQFAGSVNANGAPVYRIGTTDATTVVIEECSGCGLSGWGWADNGFGTLGPLIYFATTGPQTMRIQAREDGISIDQIVLSASRYVSASPGAAKNDSTILPETDVAPPPPPPPPTTSGDVVLYASEAAVKSGAWRTTADASAAGGARIEHPDAGGAKLGTALAAPINYFELTFDAEAGRPYHFWLRGRAAANSWANDSVFVQFDRSVDAAGAAIDRIGTTNAEVVTLEDCVNCGVAGWGWQDNGFAGVGRNLSFAVSGTQTIRIQTREDGFGIDQIVLSPTTYLQTPPGALKNDTTILAKQ